MMASQRHIFCRAEGIKENVTAQENEAQERGERRQTGLLLPTIEGARVRVFPDLPIFLNQNNSDLFTTSARKKPYFVYKD